MKKDNIKNELYINDIFYILLSPEDKVHVFQYMQDFQDFCKKNKINFNLLYKHHNVHDWRYLGRLSNSKKVNFLKLLSYYKIAKGPVVYSLTGNQLDSFCKANNINKEYLLTYYFYEDYQIKEAIYTKKYAIILLDKYTKEYYFLDNNKESWCKQNKIKYIHLKNKLETKRYSIEFVIRHEDEEYSFIKKRSKLSRYIEQNSGGIVYVKYNFETQTSNKQK